ncbi:putative triacylglycerol lipase [Helianthus annuus]|nr:putative triacylglycerol lipase [Helianthus annuus]
MLLKVFLLCVYSSFYLCSSMGRTLIPQKNVSVSAVFVFGDSFVDQGNNNYINTLGKGNFLPYGKDFQGGKPTGRFSNGKTLPDLLVEAFGVKDYLPASLDPLIKDKDLQTGVSFASGGSGFDPLTTAETSAIPMSVQLDMFKQHILKLKRNIKEEAADNIIDNSVAVIVAVLNFIQEIYRLGVRRIAVFSAPPIGCLPVVRTLDGGPHRKCADKENNAAQLFNSFLTQQVQLWATSYPQSRVGVIDYYNPLISIIENPHKYGFDVADRGCCGTGEIEVLFLCNKLTPTCPNDSKYFFWDGFHLTEKGNSIILYHILQDLLNSLF